MGEDQCACLDVGVGHILADTELLLEGTEAVVHADQPGESAEAAQVCLASIASRTQNKLERWVNGRHGGGHADRSGAERRHDAHGVREGQED